MTSFNIFEILTAANTWEIQPFVYGKSDCCAFVSHVVKQLTGKQYLPVYDDEAYLDAFESLSDAVSHTLGEPTYTPQPGDAVLVKVFDHEGLGILLDDDHAITLFQDGMPRIISAAFVDHGWPIWPK